METPLATPAGPATPATRPHHAMRATHPSSTRDGPGVPPEKGTGTHNRNKLQSIPCATLPSVSSLNAPALDGRAAPRGDPGPAPAG